ncbi:acyl-CoA--6-aminopenicillanic acid acyl-transferase [Rossellomorea vietnamensis]|jgi:predicted choloylglycine hydrolase|uniref:Acyl-CoA--6-aminopenicillanic acid acyl-transferase n=1 Tax=Rossellomorea vietnamensis TaxID=218284 RepID=A0A6I6UT50_9BACI|nr:C45 family peptidase [Rossellomorea vietnamensis]QHE61770.1 acyl-CoA--6-aminopenicillanic acid acyl-transferase [Rossellomorea vietnamensis]
MKEVVVDVLQSRGTYYEIGVRFGQKLRQSPLYSHHEKRRKKSLRDYNVKLLEVEGLLRQFAPGLWDELNGLSHGLQWSLEDTIHEYSGFQQEWKESGCSSLAKDGIYVRNYDYHPKTYEGRLLLVEPAGGYASIGFSGRGIGRIDGLNEKGLAVGFHFVNRIKPGDGFICTTIARILLDTCKNTDEAIEVLRRLPHRHSFNYSLYDQGGKAAVVEASPRGIGVYHHSTLSCTNHFQMNHMKKDNRHYVKDSQKRLDLLHSEQEKELTIDGAFKLFNRGDSPIFKKAYDAWAGTIHTCVFECTSLRCLIGFGESSDGLVVDFQEWVRGRDIPVRKMSGKFDTNEPFLFMEEVTE